MTADATAAVALDAMGGDDPPDGPAPARTLDGSVAGRPGELPAGVPPERVPILERLFLRRLQRGDGRAFRELVRRHQDRVFGLSLRMLGDAHEAEDVAQEVFVAVHRHLPRFRGDCRLSTWIFRVTRNHCLNRLKYLERRETDGEPDLDRHDAASMPESMQTVALRPDKALLGAEERHTVQVALQRLTTEHRLLVVLRDLEGMSYEEIGRIAELPAGTVKSRLHRARAHLAELLSAAGMAPEGARGRF